MPVNSKGQNDSIFYGEAIKIERSGRGEKTNQKQRTTEATEEHGNERKTRFTAARVTYLIAALPVARPQSDRLVQVVRSRRRVHALIRPLVSNLRATTCNPGA